MIVKIIEYNSDEYQQALLLREKILRKPLGLAFSSEDMAAEAFDIHIVAINELKKVLATLCLVIISDDEVKMRQVAVSDALRGQGFGRKLVRYCERYAVKNGYSKITLSARDGAVEFYKNLNYHVDGEGFFEVGIKHFKMFKNIKDQCL